MTEAFEPDTQVAKRLFVSGISPELTDKELSARLQMYGTLMKPLEVNHKNETTTGIFGHCEILLDNTSWSRLKRLSGTVLKGARLRIEEAKPDWTQKRETDDKRPTPRVPNARKRPPPGTLLGVISKRVKRGESVQDSQITTSSRTKGWVKGRYGRAIAVLKRDGEAPLKRNPDALSKLWGVAHPRPEQLIGWYDDEEEEWYDRRGRVVRDVEITRKAKAVETGVHGRVEVWESDDDDNQNQQLTSSENYTVAGSSMPDQVPVDSESFAPEMSEAEIAAQLIEERQHGMDLISEMFKGTEVQEAAALERREKRKVRDILKIVPRYDPNRPESESEQDSDLDEDRIDEDRLEKDRIDKDRMEEAINFEDPDTADQMLEVSSDHAASNMASEVNSPIVHAGNNVLNSHDLATIFKPTFSEDEKPFQLFEHGESESEDDASEMELAREPVDLNIHPDRLNRKDDHLAHEDDTEVNANFIALKKDRGYQMSKQSAGDSGAIGSLLGNNHGSIWQLSRSLLASEIDLESIKKQWQENRADPTRDWKSKRKEGTKRMRKASARNTR